jgi:LPXTG-motif cell wall-anchored protein
MIRLQISTALIAAVLGVVAVAPTVSADQYDKKIIATFADPIEVPGGITLQPGTYVFKLQDSQNDRHIVLIQNERENHTYAQIFATNDFRLRPKGKVQIEFAESVAGSPTRLKAIFWPGDNYGQAFEYKKEQVAQVAQTQTTQTQTTQTQTTQETAAVEPAVEPAPAPEPTPQAPVETAQNTPEPAPEPAPAPAVTTPEPAPAPPAVAENTTPDALPQTASSLPLLVLLGFLSLGFAFVLSAFTRRIG